MDALDEAGGEEALFPIWPRIGAGPEVVASEQLPHIDEVETVLVDIHQPLPLIPLEVYAGLRAG